MLVQLFKISVQRGAELQGDAGNTGKAVFVCDWEVV